MNWGKGITIVIVVYCSGILFLVYKTIGVDFDLVTDDYYAKELAYQDQIDKMKNVKSLGQDVFIKVLSGNVELRFPMELIEGPISGDLLFFRPSDKSLDRTMPLELDSAGNMNIATSDMTPGVYSLQIEWQAKGVEMYSEESVYLQ